MSEVTRFIEQLNEGKDGARDRLLDAVYQELHQVAAAKIARERPGHTLQATALVHEAYLRLAGNLDALHGRRHFFAAAAEAMRRILIDHARRKSAARHGGDHHRVALDHLDIETGGDTDQLDLLALDEALTGFEAEEPDKANLVKLRYFAGMTNAEAAQAMEISVTTAERYWAYARAWLFARMRQDDED